MAIDGELVSCDAQGKPDFYALMRRRTAGLCVWCFDLLHLNSEHLRSRPLLRRKQLLSDLLTGKILRYATSFDDGEKPLSAAAGMTLEAIVSKRREASYVAGAHQSRPVQFDHLAPRRTLSHPQQVFAIRTSLHDTHLLGCVAARELEGVLW